MAFVVHLDFKSHTGVTITIEKLENVSMSQTKLNTKISTEAELVGT